MGNTKPATVLSGSAMPDAAATKEAATVEKQQSTTQTAEIKVASDVDAKVSDEEAARKAAVWIEILYAFCFLLVGFILGIYSVVWFAGPNGMDFGNSTLDVNSLFAMGIVGIGLIFWGIICVAIAAAMQVKNKTNHKVSNNLGIMNWFTLNPFSWSLIRVSNGYVSKKAKAKLAKKAAAANSDDSIDVASDVQQEQQANAEAIN